MSAQHSAGNETGTERTRASVDRRAFLKGLAAAAAGWRLGQDALAQATTGSPAAAPPGAAPSAGRPNIIFILSDDYGIGAVGCYGADKYKTPHLDALAKEGIRFEYCFSAPLCGPSRAQWLTGRYGFRTGVVDNNTGAAARPDKEITIAKLLRQAGYTTAITGKWNQLEHFTTAEDGLAWGFDEHLRWDKRSGERYWQPAYNKNGKAVEVTEKSYGPDLLQEFAVDFITRNKDKPFFAYYPMVSVHAPVLRTPDSAEGGKDFLADNIAYMDKLVGKLVAELDRLKLREKTLIVFTGDNGLVGGGSLGGRKIDGGKGSMKEGGSRVPLIVNWKGTTPEGKVSKDLIDFSDFFPTFAELAGAKPPEGVTIDGRSFAPQLKGEPGKPREWVYVQLGNKCYVRDARWKLNNDGVLFDMKDAPFQETPIAAEGADADSQAARKRLQAALDELKAPKSGAVSASAPASAPAGRGKRKKDK